MPRGDYSMQFKLTVAELGDTCILVINAHPDRGTVLTYTSHNPGCFQLLTKEKFEVRYSMLGMIFLHSI